MENIYKLLDVIDEQSNQSEVCVMEAMILSFDKASAIMEEYNGNDMSCFGLIMEQAKDESTAEKILLFIPRLIAALFKSLRDAVSKKAKTMKIDIPKELSVKKDSKLGIKLAAAGAGAALASTATGVIIMGPKNAKEVIDSAIDDVKDKKHEKETYYKDLKSIIEDYNKYKKESISAKRKDRLKDTKVFINDKGEWFVESIDLKHDELGLLKDKINKFCIFCNNDNDNYSVRKNDSHKKYDYEHFVATSAGGAIRFSEIDWIPFNLCVSKNKDSLDNWITKAHELLDYVTSKELEDQITNSIKKMITDLEAAGKTSKVVDEKNKEVGTKDLTTHYSKSKLTKYATELPKFVLQILNDYAEILSDMLFEVNKQTETLKDAINKNNNSSVNESKTSDTESKSQ